MYFVCMYVMCVCMLRYVYHCALCYGCVCYKYVCLLSRIMRVNYVCMYVICVCYVCTVCRYAMYVRYVLYVRMICMCDILRCVSKICMYGSVCCACYAIMYCV